MGCKLFYFFCCCLIAVSTCFSQETNVRVEANFISRTSNELLVVEPSLQNKTEYIQSIQYTLYQYFLDEEDELRRVEKRERKVLLPGEKSILDNLNFTTNDSQKITLVLLVYDDKEKLLARARHVVLDRNSSSEVTKETEGVELEDDIYFGRLKGIVTESVKTKPGRDFYFEFSSIYRLQQINGVEVVKVNERFSFGRSTIMEVIVGNYVVHRFFTQPRREFLLNQAKMAILKVTSYFTNMERNRSYLKSY